jgi:hypothetical protein
MKQRDIDRLTDQEWADHVQGLIWVRKEEAKEEKEKWGG